MSSQRSSLPVDRNEFQRRYVGQPIGRDRTTGDWVYTHESISGHDFVVDGIRYRHPHRFGSWNVVAVRSLFQLIEDVPREDHYEFDKEGYVTNWDGDSSDVYICRFSTDANVTVSGRPRWRPRFAVYQPGMMRARPAPLRDARGRFRRREENE